MKNNINENAGASRSQVERILEFMLAGNAITPLEAFNKFRCFRLGARIADIKKKGYAVKSRFVTTPTEKKVKQYYL